MLLLLMLNGRPEVFECDDVGSGAIRHCFNGKIIWQVHIWNMAHRVWLLSPFAAFGRQTIFGREPFRSAEKR